MLPGAGFPRSMSSQGWAPYSSSPSRDGGFLQGLAKGPSFLGRLQCRPRARSMELPGSPPKGPLRATSEFLDSGTSSFLWRPQSPRPLDRSPSPSLLRDIHPTEPGLLSWDLFGKSSDPLLGRRTSLPHLLDWAGSGVPGRPLALQSWSRSEQDVWPPSLLDGVPQRVELVGPLQSARGTPKEWAQETQRREKALELSQIKWELLDLRQKQLESSLVRLQWQRRELESSRRQEQQQDRELHSKILHLQAEVSKVKLCLDRMSQKPLFVEDPEEKPGLGDQGQERNSDATEALGEGEGPLEGPRASTPSKSFDVMLLQEELAIIKEENEQLSSELSQSRQRLRTCLDQLHQLQAEKLSHGWAQVLEAERAQLVGENVALLAVLQGSGGRTELRPASWQNGQCRRYPQFQKGPTTPQLGQAWETSCPRTHWEVAQYWKARWRQVANELKSKEEELEGVQRQRRHELCKIPWVQELLTGEEEELVDPMDRAKETSELGGMQLDSSSPAGRTEYQQGLGSRPKVPEREDARRAPEIQRPKPDRGPTPQTELEACKQQLEVERSLSRSLQAQLRGLQSGSACQRAEPPQAAPSPGPSPPAEPQRPLQGLRGSPSGSPQAPEPPQPFPGNARGPLGAPAPASEAEAPGQQQEEEEESLRRAWEQGLRSLRLELQELKLRKPEEHKVSPPTAQDSGRQGLEVTESQLQENRKENLSLELLVTSLLQKLEEKEQALKELLSPGASEHGKTELTPSTLLKKLPPPSRSGFSRLLSEELRRGPQASWEGVPQGHCSHCNAFLEQLRKVLQGWEPSSKPPEEKPQPLRQLQKVLEGPNKHVPKGARAPRNDLKDMERVRQQHRLVTEELQDLFGEKRERTVRAAQPPREWPEGSSGDPGAKKPSVEQVN